MNLKFRIACPECEHDSITVTMCVPPDPKHPNGAKCDKCGHEGQPSDFMLAPRGDTGNG